MKNPYVITRQAPAACELCGKFDELRPFGPNGEKICFACGRLDVAMTEQKMREAMSGADYVILDLDGVAECLSAPSGTSVN